jgi:hypothetical protein
MFGFHANNNEDNALLSIRDYLKKIVSYQPARELYTEANPYALWSPDSEPQTRQERTLENTRCTNYIMNHMKHWKRQLAAQHFFKEKYESLSPEQRMTFDWNSWAENFVSGYQGPFKAIHPDKFQPNIWQEQPSILLVGRLNAVSN